MAKDSELLKSIRSAVRKDAIAPSERLADYAVDGVVPQIAVSPSTAEEVAAVLAAASRQQAIVIPWGGGASMAIGNPPRRYDIALDTTRLNQVVLHVAEDLTVSVQAGIRLQELQEHLAQKGQYLPFDPPFAQSATIGGILAANTGGPSRYAFGWPRDWTLGMKVALADGSLAKSGGRVVKNVAGYDMGKLYIGSFGTLGVIVEAAFKVTPLPEARATAIAFFDSCAAAAEAGLAVRKRYLNLVALEVVSTNTDVFAAVGIEPLTSGWALMVAAAGNAAAVERSLKETEEVCREQASIALQKVADDRSPDLWEQVRRLCSPSQDSDYLLARAGLLPSQVAAFIEALSLMAQERGLSVQVVSHLGVGTVYSLWRAKKSDLLERGVGLVSALRSLAAGYGGALVIEGCPTALKQQIDVWGEPRGDIPLMRRIKEQLDPAGTLSAGRFLGGL